MAGAFERAIRQGRSGYTRSKKRRKKKPQGTSVRAIEGGKGVKKETRQAKRVKRKTPTKPSVRSIEGGKGVKREKRQARRVQRKQARRQARKSQKLLRDVVSGKRKVKTAEKDESLLDRVADAATDVLEEVNPPGADPTKPIGLVTKEDLKPGALAETAATLVPGGAGLKIGAKGIKLGTKIIKGQKAAKKAIPKAPKRPRGQPKQPKPPKTAAARKAQRARGKARRKAQAVSARGVARRTARKRPIKREPKGARARTEGRLYSVATQPAAIPAVTAAAGVAGTTAKVAKEHPLEFAEVTGRTVPGIAAGVAGLAGDVGTTALRQVRTQMADVAGTGISLPGGKKFTGKEITDPVKRAGEEYLDYVDKVAIIAEGGKEGEDLVREQFGGIPLVSGALAGAGFVGAKRGIKPKATPEPGEPKGVPAREFTTEPGEIAARRPRKKGAERAAVAREKIQARGEFELKGIAKHVNKLNRKRLGGRKSGLTRANAVFPLARRGMNLDKPQQTLGRLRRQLDELQDATKYADPESASSRRVLPALIEEIERNPKFLQDRDLRDVISKLDEVQGKRALEMAAAEGVDPVKYQRARLAAVADELGVTPVTERPVAGLPPVKLRKGENFDQAVRRSARDEKRQAGRVEQRAKLKLREARRVRQRVEASPATGRAAAVEALQVERDAARGVASARDEAAARVAKANQRVAALPKSRIRRAEGLNHEARRLEGEQKFAEADDLRRQAATMTREALEDSDQALRDFVEETMQAIEREGFSPPVYLKETDVARPASGGQEFGAGIPARDKFRAGTLEREGRVDVSAETLLNNLVNRRRKVELNRMWADAVNEDSLRIGGKKAVTRDQFDELVNRGKVPKGYRFFPQQEFARALEADKWSSAAGLVDSALRRELHELQAVKGDKGVIMPTAEIKELVGQVKSPDKLLRAVRVLSTTQSLLMLAASPAWFTFQLVASPFALMVNHSNPVQVANAARNVWRARNRIIEQDGMEAWRTMQSEYGGHVTDVTMHPASRGFDVNAAPQLLAGARVANKTPVGRALRAVWKGRAGVQRGGPLMYANRKYEAYVRMVAGELEGNRMLRDPLIRRTTKKIARLHDDVMKDMERVAKMHPADRMRYIHSDNKRIARLRKGVNEALGDWMTLSTRERWPAALTVFYPFLRMSLKWTFISTPRRHPIKAAILLNLAQQNSQELEKLLGSKPDQFYDWAQAVSHTGEDGEPSTLLNTARWGPSSNALVEAMGGSRTLAAGLTAPLQPLITAGAHAAFGTDPFTGEPTDEKATTTIAKQLLGLPAPLRPLVQDKFGSDSEVAEFFRRNSGRPQGLASLDPTKHFTRPVQGAQKSAALSRLLKEGEGPDDAAAIEQFKGAGDPVQRAIELATQVSEDDLQAQAARREMDKLLQQEGLAGDPEIEEAIDIYFEIRTPARFGNKPSAPESGTGLFKKESGSSGRSPGLFKEDSGGPSRSPGLFKE